MATTKGCDSCGAHQTARVGEAQEAARSGWNRPRTTESTCRRNSAGPVPIGHASALPAPSSDNHHDPHRARRTPSRPRQGPLRVQERHGTPGCRRVARAVTTGGNLLGEQHLEEAASYDEEAELADEGRKVQTETQPRPITGRRTSQLTDDELQQALALRKKAAHSNDIDLGSIARSSAAVSHSPPNRAVPINTDANTIAVTV
ncbi:hypothetical protein EVJ58_g3157 [Rhodofomes roseus]|uniref:Uncharacterized protein n=1 Tax=Rhodofomes roseus TaxID=34475 RepID=A0A4Y9YM06_9APHY|nr:hypothetical protein EVJ58_g3157 [Rhodofomes roseus]